MTTVPCLASKWADEYSDMQDAWEAKVSAIYDDPDHLEHLALRYVEKFYPELEFDSDDQWHQWIADNADRIIEWSN